MRKLIYSMGASLDGFIAGPDGEIAVPVPDDELHRFHNEQMRQLGAHLCGRRLYEVMSFWDTAAPQDPSAPAPVREFARIWVDLPKIVFSTTLTEVGPNARLLPGGVAEEVEALKRQPGRDLGVGGAGLAATLIERDLIDEYRLFIAPVVAGGGTAFFPPLEQSIGLQLVETRTFAGGTAYLRCARSQ